MRPSCRDCARKHLAQAAVLMAEAQMGYPRHTWLAIGHMAEAADELVRDEPALANRIRQERLLYTRIVAAGPASSIRTIDIMALIDAVSLAEADQPRDQRFDAQGLYVPKPPEEYVVSGQAVMEPPHYESAHDDTAPTVPVGAALRPEPTYMKGTRDKIEAYVDTSSAHPYTAEELARLVPRQADPKRYTDAPGYDPKATKDVQLAHHIPDPFPGTYVKELCCADKAAMQTLTERLAAVGKREVGPPICTTVLLTTLGDFQPAYSLSSVIIEQAHALVLMGHLVVVVVHLGANLTDLPPLPAEILILPIMPRVPLADDLINEPGVVLIRDMLWHLFNTIIGPDAALKHPHQEDVRVISHDCCFQAAFVTVAKAIHWLAAMYRDTRMEALPWYHLAHSSVGERSTSTVERSGGEPFKTEVRPIWYRQNLPPGHHLIVLNQSDVPHFARYYAWGHPTDGLSPTPIDLKHIHALLNPRDIRLHLRMTALASQLTTRYQLHLADVTVLFPASFTRLRAKGLDPALATLGALKRMGLIVRMLIPVAHANGDRVETMAWVRSICQRENLLLAPEVEPVPVAPPTGSVAIDAHRATPPPETVPPVARHRSGAGTGDYETVADAEAVPEVIMTCSVLPSTRAYGLDADTLRSLWPISNLFLMPSISEAGPLVLLEAALSGCLLCLNAALPALHDYIPMDKAVWVPWGAQKGPGAPMDWKAYDQLAERLWGALQGQWASAKRYAMRQSSLEVYGMHLHATLGFAVEGLGEGFAQSEPEEASEPAKTTATAFEDEPDDGGPVRGHEDDD
jgi:hypothetical protein